MYNFLQCHPMNPLNSTKFKQSGSPVLAVPQSSSQSDYHEGKGAINNEHEENNLTHQNDVDLNKNDVPLQIHESDDENQKNHDCPHCDLKFSLIYTLERHIDNAHKNIEKNPKVACDENEFENMESKKYLETNRIPEYSKKIVNSCANVSDDISDNQTSDNEDQTPVSDDQTPRIDKLLSNNNSDDQTPDDDENPPELQYSSG